MTQNKNQTHIFYGYAMSKFLPTSGFKWIDPKNVDSSKYSSNSFKGCALEVDLEYPKELHMNYKARIKTKKG